jgi:hypothetical protein
MRRHRFRRSFRLLLSTTATCRCTLVNEFALAAAAFTSSLSSAVGDRVPSDGVSIMRNGQRARRVLGVHSRTISRILDSPRLELSDPRLVLAQHLVAALAKTRFSGVANDGLIEHCYTRADHAGSVIRAEWNPFVTRDGRFSEAAVSYRVVRCPIRSCASCLCFPSIIRGTDTNINVAIGAFAAPTARLTPMSDATIPSIRPVLFRLAGMMFSF